MADQDDDDDRLPSWTVPLLLGVFAGLTMGVLVVLLRDRNRGLSGVGLASPQPLPPINIWNITGGASGLPMTQQLMPAQMPATPYMAPEQARQLSSAGAVAPISAMPMPDDAVTRTRTATVTINASATSRLVAAAGGMNWHVQVRTIGPPGTYAYFSNDSNSLAMQGVSDEALALPAGAAPQDIYLQPGQFLFARGSIDGVVVSFSAQALG